MKFRKKPVIIEAISVAEANYCAQHNWKGLPSWLVSQYDKGNIVFAPSGININTLEGRMLASPDDMIICGINGEIYPCKPDIFEKTYEHVED